ncbi:MAG TPA: Minf_1886 family protein [Pirellulales bacterium]|nr:Minf_1886 family protein [Pirellulales bacterium]
MIDPAHPIAKLLKEDRRYKIDAYAFVFEALNFAHSQLGMGAERPTEAEEEPEEGPQKETERHLTGQQLCEAIRQYALEQYGYMAQCVLNSWGVTSTSDFGEIVFNLIGIGQMRKTSDDRREDFNDVFDFESGLRQSFKITPPES